MHIIVHVCFVIFLCQAPGSSAWNLVATPKHRHLNPRSSVDVTCSGVETLVACEFAVADVERTFATMNFSAGTETPVVQRTFPDGDVAYRARYHGNGLESGQCGIRLSNVFSGRYVVGCRAKAARGGWKQAVMTLLVSEGQSVTMNVTPSVAILERRHVNIQCKVDGSLKSCNIYTPGSNKPKSFSRGRRSKVDGKFSYYGDGLGAGHCGVSIDDVTASDVGPVWCWGRLENGKHAVGATILTVFEFPRAHTLPELTLLRGSELREGDHLEAECRGAGFASVNLYLGAQRLEVEDVVQTWRWPWQPPPAQQVVDKVLELEDDGKDVICRYNSGGQTKQKISVAARDTTVAIDVRALSVLTTDNTPTTESTTSESAPTTEPTTEPPPTTTTTTEPAPTSTAHCPPLEDPAIEYSCQPPGSSERVSCAVAMREGTSAMMECKDGYDTPLFTPHTIRRCTKQGVWSAQPLHCTPDCGRRNFEVQQLTAGGERAQGGEFPWHVGIFRKKDDERWQQICGGTLVTPTVAVSAAHCFYNTKLKVQRIDPSQYNLVAGKFYRDWYTEEAAAQYRNISDIVLPDRYKGTRMWMAFDIALVRVSEPIALSLSVNVACVDWRGDSEVIAMIENTNGTVVGWGITENNTFSDVLYSVKLPYVPQVSCKSQVPESFDQFITSDKICGGFLNAATSVCMGDSGGGYMFPLPASRGNQYYLRGVVSVAPISDAPCNWNQLAAFTRISEHLQWLMLNVFDS